MSTTTYKGNTLLLTLSDIPFAVRKVLREAVDRGARRLDHRRPNWYKQIDPKLLDLSSACNCVIGQLYGTFEEGAVRRILNNLRTLSWDNYGEKSERYGFVIPSEVDTWADEVYYSDNDEWQDRNNIAWHALDTYWKQEILKRRKADREQQAA